MKRLKIIIPQEKRYILSILYEKFPLFAVDMIDKERPIIFTANLSPDIDYSADLAWLKRIGLAYFDEQMERHKIITAFFHEVSVEGMPITNVRFSEVNPNSHSYFCVTLTLRDSIDMTLQFPNSWEPPTIG
jgi:hypothetical protein